MGWRWGWWRGDGYIFGFNSWAGRDGNRGRRVGFGRVRVEKINTLVLEILYLLCFWDS